MWHIVTMDGYVSGPYDKKKDAIRAYGFDMWPEVRRWNKGAYNYRKPDFAADKIWEYNVVDDNELASSWPAARQQYVSANFEVQKHARAKKNFVTKIMGGD